MATHLCRICRSTLEGPVIPVREMMYGLRETFDYGTCPWCGCLQILEIPADLSRHYPSDYYSFKRLSSHPLRRFLKTQRARKARGGHSLVGAILLKVTGPPEWMSWPLPEGDDSPILEVGCGSGQRLLDLHGAGYRDLTGIDPYLEEESEPAPGVRLLAREIKEIHRSFDFVMMHHVLEHVVDPLESFTAAAALLKPGGCLYVRTPLADSFAFRKYGSDWVQLDAPRHIAVMTKKSLSLLAEAAHLEVEEVVLDSGALQFWGSEQYRRGVPLVDDTSFFVHPGRSAFSRKDIESFRGEAAILNEKGEGDQACFTFRKGSEKEQNGVSP